MQNRGKKVLSILLVIVLLLSVTNAFAANALGDSEVPYGHEPWLADDSWEEYESFLPEGITRELAQGIWFDDDREMYYIPLLGLYYDSEKDMLFEPGYAIWWEDDEEPTVSVYDLPVTGAFIDGHWLEFDTVFPAYETIMPASSPTVTLSISNITNTSVDLTGEIFNIGGATIRRRGFWLRRDDSPTDFDEHLVNSSINPFGMRITVTSGHLYHARAIIRIEGGTGSITSAAQTFRTPGGGGSNPTSSPPPGGSTATPPPGGSTATPPPGGSTPTPIPTPPPPMLNFEPANSAPWNNTTWVIGAGQQSTSATVRSNHTWNWTQSNNTQGWLTVSGSGAPGTNLEISASQNDTGAPRMATVTVTSAGLTRTLAITQNPLPVTIRRSRVIERFNQPGYVDVYGSTASIIEWGIRGTIVNNPVWYFTHIGNNVFRIQNDTTGHFFTATDNGLTHGSNLGANNIRQHWRIVAQANGTYRIRSMTNEDLYVTESILGLTLASRNTSNNSQSFRIGYIWHITNDGYQQEFFNFWPGDINIWVWPVGTPPAEFDFRNRMATARTAWSNALGISFTPVGNMYSANIRAYGGRRTSVQDRVGERNGPYLPIDHRYGVHLNQTGSGGIAEGRVRAGGVERSVFRLTGSGTSAEIIAVFSDSGSWLTTDARNINFATMTAIHELGHALGYMGHSPNANDVMRGAPPMLSPNETLRPAEIEHLRQIYRRFR